jgi:hypothetical protein
VRNEIAVLDDWLDSVRFADRVVLADHGSRDGTRERLAELGERARTPAIEVVDVPPGGIIEDVRGHAMERVDAGWVLVLDLDERVPIPLRDEILATIARDPPEAAFRIPFRHYAFGRWLRHGGWDDAHVRLLRAGRCAYAPGRIHAQPEVDGAIGDLSAFVVHFAHPRIADFLAKMNRYTSQSAPALAAGEAAGLRRRPALPARPLAWLRACFSVFWGRYVRHGGFRDGRAGFILAALLAAYRFVEQAKAWEAREVDRAAEDAVRARGSAP